MWINKFSEHVSKVEKAGGLWRSVRHDTIWLGSMKLADMWMRALLAIPWFVSSLELLWIATTTVQVLRTALHLYIVSKHWCVEFADWLRKVISLNIFPSKNELNTRAIMLTGFRPVVLLSCIFYSLRVYPISSVIINMTSIISIKSICWRTKHFGWNFFEETFIPWREIIQEIIHRKRFFGEEIYKCTHYSVSVLCTILAYFL